MKTICILENPIQTYAWGSRTAIAHLTGRPSPTEKPEAEMWLGAHPKAPSMVETENGFESLLDLIGRNPQDILGKQVATEYKGRLPFLFKVLAAEKPLSIQAHPNLTQAGAGYQWENRQNIALDAADRNYRDDNHKPECICALTRFWGMNGFRKISEIKHWLGKVCPHTLDKEIHDLENRSDSMGLKTLIKTLLDMDGEAGERTLSEAVYNARRLRDQDPVFNWMVKLYDAYPGDIGVLFPGILNLICLEPGQAMFLPAGRFHAYLEGVGLELMANSDNVLRGGLTPKHVDVSELMKVLVFREQPIDILFPEQARDWESVYRTPAREFELSVIELDEEGLYTAPEGRSSEILLITAGKVVIVDSTDKSSVKLTRGMSVIVPAIVKSYEISGNGTIFKATVP